jgi:hypothetical protein
VGVGVLRGAFIRSQPPPIYISWYVRDTSSHHPLMIYLLPILDI